MKKTLIVLCFAVCASVAFAQTNKMARPTKSTDAAIKIEAPTAQRAADFKGSIFTKAEGEVLYSTTFATAPTTGTLGAEDVVAGTAMGADGAHGQTQAYGCSWHRVADTSLATRQSLAQQWPVMFGFYFDDNFPFTSNTPNDGFMCMAMMDQIAAWGGSGQNAGINSYFAIPTVSVSSDQFIDVRFYQYYRKFNSDKCNVDYSYDGSTWYTVEINVRGVDVQVNSILRGRTRATIPVNGNSNINLRIRWSCLRTGDGGGAYGYWWCIDDLSVEGTPATRLTVKTNEYFEGFYHMIPQGLQVPMVWNCAFQNTGYQTLNNVNGTIYTMANRFMGSTAASTVNIASVASNADTNVLIDPKGWWAANGFGYITNDPSQNPSHGTLANLPTSDLGTHYVFADVNATGWDHAYKLVDTMGNVSWMTFDTLAYQVNAVDEETLTAVWARDNGMLTRNNYWIYGMVSEGTFSSDAESVEGYHTAGYRVWVSYLTGDNVPAGWRIKGVQLVASTDPSTVNEGAQILGDLRKDSVYAEGDSWYVSFGTVETGSNVYEITEDDLNLDEDFEYATNGDYNVINLEFPNQPELEANTAYRIGYVNATDDYFAVATGNPIGYYGLDEESHYFVDNPGLYDYATNAGAANYYSVMIGDAMYPSSTTGSIIHWFQVDNYPMIRMLVGPYEVKPKTTVTFECGANGAIYNNNYDDLCGTTDSVIINSRQTYLFSPEEGYVVDQIFENGEVVFTNEVSDEQEEIYAGDLSEAFTFGSDPVTIGVTFKAAGINAVDANVKMSLQPNPATSNAKLSISGVEGMVELSLIDMSGRVISSSKVNAEMAQNINLNGLAKGAYFVRITNSNMTKVAKLIVR